MTTEQYVARLEAESARVTRHCCNVFKFWRTCPFKPCRKARLCSGDQNACLKKREQEVSRERQFKARQQVLASTPANAGPPERTAREFLPDGLRALPRGGGRDGCG